MNVTKDVIADLYPLYAENECTEDTRALVEEYLKFHAEEATDLRRKMSAGIPRQIPPAQNLEEVQSLQVARRRLRMKSWLMAAGIFFSLAPFSFLHTNGRTYWLFVESPNSAIVYGALAVIVWISYAMAYKRGDIL